MNMLAHPIDYQCPIALFSLFEAQKGAMLFHSGLKQGDFGRYSYIAVDPFKWITFKNEPGRNVAAELKALLKEYAQPLIPGLPPFQGGLAGAFSYEFYRYIENIMVETKDEMDFPDMVLGVYDTVISFDHAERKAWIISAPERLNDYLNRLSSTEAAHLNCRSETSFAHLNCRGETSFAHLNCRGETSFAHLNCRGETSFALSSIESNFTQPQYETAVQTIIDYILAGDIFEANLSQRFEAKLSKDFSSYDFFTQLSQTSPAPFSAYINLGDTQIISASPERFVKLSQHHVETRPIKGTCKRGATPEEDIALADALKNSEKDNAENIMIVDLLRNDLSKVCEDHSVEVTQLCGVETYANVHHLVSVIKGKLSADKDAIDLLWALFPGGSITGAPKIRAMEIIAEMEQIHRGIYCGSIGFIGFNGEMDTSIAIRTATVKNNRMCFQAGGAIVADSDPRSEYEETMTKSISFRNLLVGAKQFSPSNEVWHDLVD